MSYFFICSSSVLPSTRFTAPLIRPPLFSSFRIPRIPPARLHSCTLYFWVLGLNFLSYCQQVEHGVGASAHGDVQGHGVEECVEGSYIAWQYALVAVLIICI